MKPAVADDVVRAAVRSLATRGTPPAEPSDPGWAERAAKSGLLPVVVAELRRGGATVADSVGRASLFSAGVHLRALTDLRGVARALDAVNVRWLVLKGPILSDLVYSRPGLRTYVDLDVLIHPLDLELAMSALTSGPAVLIDTNWVRIRQAQQSELSLILENGSLLDLHWHVITNPVARAEIGLAVERLFDAAIWVDAGGTRVRTLSPVDTVIHLALHAALSGGHRLRWLLDIQQAVEHAAPEVSVLAARARQLGALPVLRIMLQRTAEEVDPRLFALVSRLGGRSLWTALCGTTRWWAHLDVSGTAGYSGWILVASTRRTTLHSARAAMRMAWVSVRRGKARRSSVPDAALLRQAAGGEDDRQAWFAIARAHAAPPISS